MAAWTSGFAEMGQVRSIELTRGPTGLDMRMARDGEYFRVTAVSPRGSADQAGIVVGDVLLAANGVGLVGASDQQADEIMFRDLMVTFVRCLFFDSIFQCVDVIGFHACQHEASMKPAWNKSAWDPYSSILVGHALTPPP
jgi:hypothetical protein